MKKAKQRLVLSFASLLFLSSLSSCGGNNGLDENAKKNNATEKANFGELIGDYKVDVTNNFNQTLVRKTSSMENEVVSIIVELDGETTSDAFLKQKAKFDSVKDYSDSSEGITLNNELVNAQAKLANRLLEKKLVSKIKTNYTVLMNGFSAKTEYKNVETIRNLEGVKDVYVSTQYAPAAVERDNKISYGSFAANNNQCDVETGIAENDTEYKGQGMVVAVLDSGLDYHHNAFLSDVPVATITKEKVANVLDKTVANSLYKEELTVDDVYLSRKVPFAYDYADNDADVLPAESDHGTHVSGIIVGDDEVSGFQGVTPDAQLVFMKVFADEQEKAQSDVIINALEDCVLLGVDVINESLGSICGYSSDTIMVNEVDHLNNRTMAMYNRVVELGISSLASAGNDYFQAYGTDDGSNLVTNPESGNIGAPASYSNQMAVASGDRKKTPYLLVDGTNEITFSEAYNNNSKEYDLINMIFEKYNLKNETTLDPTKDVLELDYVVIPNVGDASDYENLDVQGKIAIVSRGTSTFEDKIKNASEKGAIGILIYNNVSGVIRMTCGDSLILPAASLTNYQGHKLVEKGHGKIKFSKTLLHGPFMSDFSSLGANPDLTLKPEITSCGGDVLSSVIGGGYEEFSGTSMSCPNTAGIMVAVRQYIQANWPELTSTPVSEMTAVKVNTLAQQLLMSTAVIAIDENGTMYSPRKQGAGYGSVRNCIEAGTYLHIGDSDKVKIELGDDKQKTGVYTLEFNIKNTTAVAASYELNDNTMTETPSLDGKSVLNTGHLLSNTTSIEGADGVTVNGKIVTVAPHTDGKITVTLTLSDADKKFIDESFPNGMYVEGFITLTAQNSSDVNLSVPFLGFYGDWAEAPVWDKSYYDVQCDEYYDENVKPVDREHAALSELTPYGQYGDFYMLPLGGYVYSNEGAGKKVLASEEKAAISLYQDALYNFYTVRGGLLRSAKSLTFTITDAVTGEVYMTKTTYDNRKDSYYPNSGGVMPFTEDYTFSALENALSNNTKLIVTLEATLDYGDGHANHGTTSFSFYVDYEAPTLENVEYYKELSPKGTYNYYVDVTVSDNRYAMSYAPCLISEINGKPTLSMIDSNKPIWQENANESTAFRIDITDYMSAITNSYTPDTFYLLLDDYAMNQGLYYITLNGSEFKDLTFNTEEIVISQNEVVDLADYVNLDDAMLEGFTWTVSSPKVASIKEGQIYGASRGTTIAYGTSTHDVSLSVKVKVLGPNDAGYVAQPVPEIKKVHVNSYTVLNSFDDDLKHSTVGGIGSTKFNTKDVITIYPGESVKLNWSVEPWYLNSDDVEVTYKAASGGVVKLDFDNGIVTGASDGKTAITVYYVKDGQRTKIRTTVYFEVLSPYVTQGSWLTAYKGNEEIVTLNSDITGINQYAFSLYTYFLDGEKEVGYKIIGNDIIKEINLSPKTKYIYQYAMAGLTSLESITIPFEVQELMNNVFEGDTSLKEVTFAENSKLVKILYEAFKGCTDLTTIDLSHISTIGSRAFQNCTSLDNIDLSNMVYYGANVFENCTSLKNVTMSNKTAIGNYMFKNTGFETLTLGQDYIGKGAFENCKNLTSVTFTNPNVYIDKDAFKGCNKLTSVNFVDETGNIVVCDGAFNGTGITSFQVKQGKLSLGANVFSSSSLETLSLGEATLELTSSSPFANANEFNEIAISASSTYKVVDGILYSGDNTTIILVPTKKVITTISDAVVTIASGAFASNASTTISVSATGSLENIQAYAFANSSLVSLTINNDNSVAIADHAFDNATSLETLVVNNIASLGKYALANTKVTSLTLSNAVIPSYALTSSTLTEVIITGDVTIEPYAFYKAFAKAGASVTVNGEAYIGEHAFEKSNISTFTATSITSIGEYAFSESGLTSITLSSATKLAKGVFNKAEKLTNVELGEQIYRIPEYAFYGCTSLETIDLKNITNIGDFAFAKATKLANISLDKVTSIRVQAFDGTAITEANLTSLKSLFSYAFVGCDSLVTVTLPSEIKSIPEGAFSKTSKLTTINLENIQTIEDFAFQEALSLASVDLSNVEIIGASAFRSSGLISANLPEVKIINELAFYGCTLTSLSMPKVQKICGYAFTSTRLETIDLPKTITTIEATAFYQNNYLKAYTIDGNINGTDNSFIVDNGVLYTINSSRKYILESYPIAKEDAEYSVLPNTIRIQEYAFYGNTHITKVTFNAELERIGDGAFYGCEKLLTYVFLGKVAPVLEGYYSANLVQYMNKQSKIPESMEPIYRYSYWYVFYFYCNFYEYVGLNTDVQLTIVYDNDATGFDSFLYSNFFQVVKKNKVVDRSYTVTFDTKGGSNISNVTVNEDETLTRPADPTKEGYTFVNWVTKDGKVYDFNSPITSDLTLKAVWKESEVTPTPVDPSSEDKPSEEPEVEQKGCGGTIIAVSSLIGSIALIGTGLFFYKKKKVSD